MQSTVSREEFVQAWVEALESGEYKQTRGALRKHGLYCCLGVACDVHSKLYPSTTLKWGHKKVNTSYDYYGSDDYVLPTVVRKRLGVSVDLQEELVAMNDERGIDFKGIAEKIKSELLPKSETEIDND